MIPRLPLEEKLAESWPPADWQDHSLVLAVSGGADSVALLRAMGSLKTGGAGRLAAAHFNHQLRGDEADADERFVAELCRQLEIPCHVGRADVAQQARRQGDGLEAAARAARYRFLDDTAQRLGARYVVTAHTADDQAETILHRVIRGTGLAGLGGMRRARPLGPAVTLIRPLLGVRRAEIVAYLQTIGQPAREDATNRRTEFTRNRLRHQLIPLLESDYNAEVVDALVRLGALAADAQAVIERLADALVERAVSVSETGDVLVDCSKLPRDEHHMVREMFVAIWRRQSWPLQAMGFDEWNLLAEMAVLSDPSRIKRTFPGRIVAQRAGAELSLTRAD